MVRARGPTSKKSTSGLRDNTPQPIPTRLPGSASRSVKPRPVRQGGGPHRHPSGPSRAIYRGHLARPGPDQTRSATMNLRIRDGLGRPGGVLATRDDCGVAKGLRCWCCCLVGLHWLAWKGAAAPSHCTTKREGPASLQAEKHRQMHSCVQTRGEVAVQSPPMCAVCKQDLRSFPASSEIPTCGLLAFPRLHVRTRPQGRERVSLATIDGWKRKQLGMLLYRVLHGHCLSFG